MSVLYVVFHGEIVFFDSCKPEDSIQAYAPEMDIHVYSAGPWLAENMIPKGLKLKLDGVSTGVATLEECREVMVIYNDAAPVAKSISSTDNHMLIELPRAEVIFSGARIDLQYDKISVKPPHTFSQPSDYANALCTVFQYTTNTVGVPQLLITGNLNGTNEMNPAGLKWLAAEGKSGYFVLHFYAEADVLPDSMHIEQASRKGASLVGVDLTFTVSPAERPLGGSSPHSGLFTPELNLTLFSRLKYLENINEQLHAGNPKCLNWAPVGSSESHLGTPQCGVTGGVGRK